jgi:predicted nucleic acid-binding protein
VPAGGVVLVDTGPLVALFDPSDANHERCKDVLGRLRSSRRVTSLAVLTETVYLLGFSPRAQRAVLSFLAAGGVEVADFGAADISRSAALMQRYESLPMDFADATLVVLAERLHTTAVFTLDRRDFSVYRAGRRAFRLLPAP